MKALALLAVLAGLSSAHGAAATRVKVGDDFYRARTVHVSRAATVSWHWAGHRRHDVYFVSAPRGAKPKRCSTRRRGNCSRTFRKRGRYSYVCTLHGEMTGKVIVR
jgi:plastocyanin